MSQRTHTLSADTVHVVSALPRSRSVVLTQRERVTVEAEGRGRRVNVIAGSPGPKGDKGDSVMVEPPIIIGNTAPAGRTAPWLRVELDGDGDVQRVLLGTP